MLKRIKKLSLERQLFLCFFLISLLLLTLTLGVSLFFSINRQNQDTNSRISSMASYIASMERVSDMLISGYPDPDVTEELDSLYRNSPEINVISICDPNGLRFYHSDRAESGETYTAGEETAILNGSKPYITIGYGTRGTQRRAFHAVTDDEGVIVGFVMVSIFTAQISEQGTKLLSWYIIFFITMLFVSIGLSQSILLMLKDSLMGHHPKELLDLYLKQDTVLDAMHDGLIATDSTGNIVLANEAARQIFSDCPELLNRPLTDVFPGSTADETARTGRPVIGRGQVYGGHQLLVNEQPIGQVPDVQGVLTIFNDQTETQTLMDELSGARSMLDTLRAFNHEFLNKLHIILGYLQTDQTEKAITFIMNSNLVSSDSIRQTAFCLRSSRICALVIGKMMHAAELGITLTTSPDSRCHDSDLFLAQDVYITVIGNLLENAIEELSACDKEIKEIILSIRCSEDCSIITCEDTGRGVRPELIDKIFERGVSSKGTNRGTGLYLIRSLTEEHGGEISLETEPGEGTCFTITFTKTEPEDRRASS